MRRALPHGPPVFEQLFELAELHETLGDHVRRLTDETQRILHEEVNRRLAANAGSLDELAKYTSS
jgi:hypothetical protein